MLGHQAQVQRAAGARSFFRLFAHKSEAFFYSLKTARQEAVAHITAAPEGTTLVDAVAALEQRCTVIQQYPASALARQAVIAADAELRERDLRNLSNSPPRWPGACASAAHRAGHDAASHRSP
ncbi:hypothetical protein N7U49_00350 [Streptomyces sp. AD2-2]|nr:hypothetical protein N7U49_00350 [Streptomyces sp. AD2-2]